MQVGNNININVCLLCCALLALLTSCQNTLDTAEYRKYVHSEENGLRKQKQVGPILAEVQYQPVPYILLHEFRDEPVSSDEYDKRASEMEGTQQYVLRLSIKGDSKINVTNYKVSTVDEQQERLYYLSYQLQDDIYLVDGQDTLPPSLCHFERLYDLADFRNFVLAFERRPGNEGKDKTIVLDAPFLGTGPIKLKFEAKDLANIPKLNNQYD
jgi:hypothetical protein